MIAEEKMEHGKKLLVLGVDVKPTRKGIKCRPCEAKAKKWVTEMQCARKQQHLGPGPASKLAGRLSWGGSEMFCKLGRAMLRPIYDQKTEFSGAVDANLDRSLQWWIEALSLRLAERTEWETVCDEPVHLFCDASSTPPHLGAVLYEGDECHWTHLEPPAKVLSQFRPRKDNQIMGLELLGISLGMSTFEERLRGRTVIIHCDNKGSEVHV